VGGLGFASDLFMGLFDQSSGEPWTLIYLPPLPCPCSAIVGPSRHLCRPPLLLRRPSLIIAVRWLIFLTLRLVCWLLYVVWSPCTLIFLLTLKLVSLLLKLQTLAVQEEPAIEQRIRGTNFDDNKLVQFHRAWLILF
jgi:hypothetical protein